MVQQARHRAENGSKTNARKSQIRKSQDDVQALEPETEHSTSDISSTGDLILEIFHDSVTTSLKFRVDTAALREKSRYFSRLLSGPFGESAEIQLTHQRLLQEYKTLADAPAKALPVVRIQDLGRTGVLKSPRSLAIDFLRLLHGQSLTTHITPVRPTNKVDTNGHDGASPPSTQPQVTPVANLANLAIVADRFDSLETLKNYIHRTKILKTIDARTSAKTELVLSEEKVRQRLLVGLLCEWPEWIERYSARLVLKGWVGDRPGAAAIASNGRPSTTNTLETESDLDSDDAASIPLWWDLPSLVEEELLFRRTAILETIQSLPHHFVQLYLSPRRSASVQCKLGYDSSPQCDSFQLGEMLRFFTRIDVLRIQGTLLVSTSEEIDPSSTPSATTTPPLEILSLLDTLRQTPEYQIDRNHTHCGIRTRMLPHLDLLQTLLLSSTVTGICAECWIRDRLGLAWSRAKPTVRWARSRLDGGERMILRSGDSVKTHEDAHRKVREIFVASERDWTG